MQAVDLPTSTADRTTPQGIHVLDRTLLAESAFVTPRYGWNRNLVQDLKPQEYRFFVETSFVDSDEPEDMLSGQTSDDTAYLGIVLMDPMSSMCTGAGYRSPYRTFLDSSCRSFFVPRFGMQTGTHSPHLFQDCFLTTFSNNPRSLPEGDYRDEHLLIRLREIFAIMRERTLAETIASTPPPRDSTLFDETGTISRIEQETHIGAIRWLEEHAGLSQGAIADLVGVSRQTVQNWTKGEAIRDENRQRLLAVWDVLQRVQRRRPSEDALKTWLDMPHSPDARTPRQLLVNNEVGRVRALSLSMSPPRSISSPAWLRGSPPDPWTRRQRHRRERFIRDEPEVDNDEDPDSE